MTACMGNQGKFCHYVILTQCQKVYHYYSQRSTAYLKYISHFVSVCCTLSLTQLNTMLVSLLPLYVKLMNLSINDEHFLQSMLNNVQQDSVTHPCAHPLFLLHVLAQSKQQAELLPHHCPTVDMLKWTLNLEIALKSFPMRQRTC